MKHSDMRPKGSLLLFNGSGTRCMYYKLGARGLFSEINNLLNAMLYCQQLGCALIVDDGDFQGGVGWKDLFRVDPDIMVTVERAGWKSCADIVVDGIESIGFAVVNGFISNKYFSGRLSAAYFKPFWEKEIFVQKRLLARHVVSPVTDVAIPAAAHSVSVHARYGDKVFGYKNQDGRVVVEGDMISPEAIIHKFRKLFDKADFLHLMSDSTRLVEAFKSDGYGNKILEGVSMGCSGYDQSDFDSLTCRQKKLYLRSVIRDAHLAAQCDHFLGMYKSNVSRFIALTSVNPRNCKSFDGLKKWNPL